MGSFLASLERFLSLDRDIISASIFEYVSFKELVAILASKFHGYFLDVFRFRKALPKILNICSHRTIYN